MYDCDLFTLDCSAQLFRGMVAVSGNSAPISMYVSALQNRRWRVCETEWQRFEFLD